jgi:hypothetical protein
MSAIEKSYTIRAASAKFDFSEQYIRRMILEGKLSAQKDDEGVWQIKESAMIAKQSATSSDRAERAYIVHIKKEDESAVRAALAKLNVQLEPRFVYDEKRKEYNKKRAEAKKAAK